MGKDLIKAIGCITVCVFWLSDSNCADEKISPS